MPQVLLRPTLLGIKNTFQKDITNLKEFGKLLFVVFSSAITIFFFYELSYNFISHCSIEGGELSNPFENILPNIFLGFFFLITFSAVINCLGSLFLSSDLDFLLSKPVSLKRIFFSKLTIVSFQTSWMVFIVLLAFLFAFRDFYLLPFKFLFPSIALIIPFIFFSTACSSIISTLFVYFFPAHRMKEILACIFLALAFLIFSFAKDMSVNSEQKEVKVFNKEKFHKFLSKKSGNFEQAKYMPHTLYSNYLNSNINKNNNYHPSKSALILTSLASLVALIAAFLYEKLFFRSITYAQNNSTQVGSNKHRLHKLLELVFGKFPQFKSLLYKEIRLILRDTTQSLQLLMLLVLTMAYLYNFRMLRNITHLDLAAEQWWRAILGSANAMLGGFIIAAIATRFTYPTISLEGKSWHLIRIAPLSIADFLKNKFYIWLIPLGIINLTVVLSGAFAIQLKPISIVITTICCLSLTASITALAIGAGASYAKFDWDNSSQIATGVGSLAYMTLGFILITINEMLLIPVMSIIEVEELAEKLSQNEITAISIVAILIIILLNLLVTKKSLNYGMKFLRSMEN